MEIDPREWPGYFRDHPNERRPLHNGGFLLLAGEGEPVVRMYGYPVFPNVLMMVGGMTGERIDIAPVDRFGYLLLNYCTGGRCQVDLGGDRCVFLEPGCLSIDTNPARAAFHCPTGQYRGVEMALDLEKPDPAFFAQFGVSTEALARRFCPGGVSFIAPVTGEAAKRFREINRMDRDTSLEDYRLAALAALMSLGELSPEPPRGEMRWFTRGQVETARAAEAAITADLRQKLTVEELARRLGVSASSLKSYFQGVYGEPMSSYVRKRRMEAAAARLAETDEAVTDVALAVGYENGSKFAAAFRRHWGVSPLEYRRLERVNKFT